MPIAIVVTTINDQQLAQRWADSLIREKLAACVQIVGPITSVYEWQAEIVHDTEWQLQIKTVEEKSQAVFDWLTANHPYDIPELVVLQGEASEGYSRWVKRLIRG